MPDWLLPLLVPLAAAFAAVVHIPVRDGPPKPIAVAA